MPVRDIRSNLEVVEAGYAVISTNTTTNGDIIDTADYDAGVMFAFATVVYDDGTYTPLLEESDDIAMSGATAIPDTNLIGTEAAAALSTAIGAGTLYSTIGIFGTKRYVRANIVSTAIASTGATISIVCIRKGEERPVIE